MILQFSFTPLGCWIYKVESSKKRVFKVWSYDLIFLTD
jgi:hypothetical protein